MLWSMRVLAISPDSTLIFCQIPARLFVFVSNRRVREQARSHFVHPAFCDINMFYCRQMKQNAFEISIFLRSNIYWENEDAMYV